MKLFSRNGKPNVKENFPINGVSASGKRSKKVGWKN
jgi:hypothetical protein